MYIEREKGRERGEEREGEREGEGWIREEGIIIFSDISAKTRQTRDLLVPPAVYKMRSLRNRIYCAIEINIDLSSLRDNEVVTERKEREKGRQGTRPSFAIWPIYYRLHNAGVCYTNALRIFIINPRH